MTPFTTTAGWMLCAIIVGCTHVREPYERPAGEAEWRNDAVAGTSIRSREGVREGIITGKRMIDSAILAANMAGDAAPLVGTRLYFESLLEGDSSRPLILYYMGYCDYHASLALQRTDKETGEDLIDQAIETLEKALEEDRNFADAWALLSSCYGIKASYGMFAGMTYGPKSGAAIGKGLTLEPENPRVILIAGISKFYTPEMYGGDREEALRLFRKAAAIFDAQPEEETPSPSWGHEESYTYIGMLQAERGKIDEARAAYERVLQINPEFGWVKYDLLPDLLSPPPKDPARDGKQ